MSLRKLKAFVFFPDDSTAVVCDMNDNSSIICSLTKLVKVCPDMEVHHISALDKNLYGLYFTSEQSNMIKNRLFCMNQVNAM